MGGNKGIIPREDGKNHHKSTKKTMVKRKKALNMSTTKPNKTG